MTEKMTQCQIGRNQKSMLSNFQKQTLSLMNTCIETILQLLNAEKI